MKNQEDFLREILSIFQVLLCTNESIQYESSLILFERDGIKVKVLVTSQKNKEKPEACLEDKDIKITIIPPENLNFRKVLDEFVEELKKNSKIRTLNIRVEVQR